MVHPDPPKGGVCGNGLWPEHGVSLSPPSIFDAPPHTGMIPGFDAYHDQG